MIAFPPDITFVIQVISFFALWLGLKQLVFDPFLRVIDERRARTTGVREEAEQLRSGAITREAQYDQRIEQVRADIGRETDASRHATEEEEHQIIVTARDQAAARLKQRREQIEADATSASSQLAAEASQLAQLIAGKVVGGGRA
jgi:F-type H+-transporting ATPase subunit b